MVDEDEDTLSEAAGVCRNEGGATDTPAPALVKLRCFGAGEVLDVGATACAERTRPGGAGDVSAAACAKSAAKRAMNAATESGSAPAPAAGALPPLVGPAGVPRGGESNPPNSELMSRECGRHASVGSNLPHNE